MFLFVCIFFFCFSTQYAIDSIDLELKQVIYVSRHGIRSPYPPNYGTVEDFSAYTNKKFPSHEAWGMTQKDFAKQKLTPHGKKILPYVGSYFYERFTADQFNLNCENIICFADDSSRDIETAHLWLKGFGCPETFVNIVNRTHSSDMLPVLYDLFNSGCPIASEEQTLGLIGGNVDALTTMYASSIELVMDILNMPTDASICELSNSNFDSHQECTLFDTGYRWTGYVYDGGFKSPMYYSRYFAEYFMLQYLSNVTEWAFGLLTPRQLLDINAMHVKTHELGTNYWFDSYSILRVISHKEFCLLWVAAISIYCCLDGTNDHPKFNRRMSSGYYLTLFLLTYLGYFHEFNPSLFSRCKYSLPPASFGVELDIGRLHRRSRRAKWSISL
jgi:hypothetical protein